MSNTEVTTIILSLSVIIALATIYFTFIKKGTESTDSH